MLLEQPPERGVRFIRERLRGEVTGRASGKVVEESNRPLSKRRHLVRKAPTDEALERGDGNRLRRDHHDLESKIERLLLEPNGEGVGRQRRASCVSEAQEGVDSP